MAGGIAAGFIVLLVVVGVLAGSDDDEDPTPGAGSEVPADAYLTGDGCISLVVPDAWTATVEYPEAGSAFSAGPGEPIERAPDRGQPGVFVELSCPRLDQVGTSGPVDVPGAGVVEESTVALDGDEGQLRSYSYEAEDPADEMRTLQVTVDTEGVRCSFRASGTATAMADARPDLDAALATMACRGR